MTVMEDMKIYTFDEMLDKHVGKQGTPERTRYDNRMDAFLIGEAIKNARQQKNLTQEELGEMVGVRRAQISRIESGRNLTIGTISRIFKAMGINPFLDLGSMGRVAL